MGRSSPAQPKQSISSGKNCLTVTRTLDILSQWMTPAQNIDDRIHWKVSLGVCPNFAPWDVSTETVRLAYVLAGIGISEI